MLKPLGFIAGLLLISACSEHHFEPPSREDQVVRADSTFSPALFDSITWPNQDTRLLEGNATYAAECRRCHGTNGEGGTAYALERSLDVPVLTRLDWPQGDSVKSVRHRIFIGHPNGMPTWGVAGISLREIDAVAAYVVQQLRPDAR
jgi:mono/diheme cytochrome c family protein